MNVDITNHLVPWTTVKKLLKGAWDEGRSAGRHDRDNYILHTNPYQEEGE